MKKGLILLLMLMAVFSMKAADQTVLVVKGNLSTPITVETSDGTYEVYTSLTIHKLVSVRSAYDANGCQVVVPMSSSSSHTAYRGDNKVENEHTRTYTFSMLYDSKCAGGSSSSSSSGSQSSGGSYSTGQSKGTNWGDALAYAAAEREFYQEDIEFAFNLGGNLGYGRTERSMGMGNYYYVGSSNYVPFGFDLSAGIRSLGCLTTCLGMATEFEWKTKSDFVVFSLPIFADVMYDFSHNDEVSFYLGAKLGNAFKWFDILKKYGEYGRISANLYAGIRFGWHFEGFDLRILEYTYEGRPSHRDGRNAHMITMGMGVRL